MQKNIFVSSKVQTVEFKQKQLKLWLIALLFFMFILFGSSNVRKS